MRMRTALGAVAAVIISIAAVAAPNAHASRATLPGTVDALLALDAGPFAIGHRGFGENLGEDSTRPLENTVPAVRRGFSAGLTVVEVDVQLTRDGEVAVFHDEFLPDRVTCVNRVTLAELQARLPHVPSLTAVLNQARRFNQESGSLRGLVIVELKPTAPACDPHDAQESAIVARVTSAVRRMGMADQALFTSFSPALLFLAAQEAPDITRILAVSGLQLLPHDVVERIFFPLPVVLVPKRLDLGLTWAEIGPFLRLPGYRSIVDVVSTAARVGAAVVEVDVPLLESAGALLVPALHAAGFKVFGFTANDAADWELLESLGVDGIYTNDVPLGVRSQAVIP